MRTLDIARIEQAVSARLGRAWKAARLTDLNDRASHPCAVVHGRDGFDVFVKQANRAEGIAELKGLNLIRRLSGVRTPVPVGDGMVDLDQGCLLLLEALPEVPDKKPIGHALAALHGVHADGFGLVEFDGFFGPLPQDNRPVATNRWADFYAQRRLEPLLRLAVASGRLPEALRHGVEDVIGRLDRLAGPEPEPTLLHGDAQQNNFLTLPSGEAVLFDTAPYFGHPEIDLALIDYFAPVPAEVFESYRELRAIDEGFAQRRELWRLHAYLAVVIVDGASEFGRPFLDRIARAIAIYR